MKEENDARTSRRYLALDIHKQYCVIAGVDREGRVMLQPVRVDCRLAACRSGRVAEEESADKRSGGDRIHNECLACVRSA